MSGYYGRKYGKSTEKYGEIPAKSQPEAYGSGAGGAAPSRPAANGYSVRKRCAWQHIEEMTE